MLFHRQVSNGKLVLATFPNSTYSREVSSGTPGGGDYAYETGGDVGMLVVSLRGVNFVFWSHLACSGQNAIIFSREGLV